MTTNKLQATSAGSHPVMAIQTRAQKAKEDQRRAQEDRESEGSGIQVTNLSQDDTVVTDSQCEQLPEESPEGFDDVMEPGEDNGNSLESLVEEDGTDPLPLNYPHDEPALPNMPLGAEAFSKKQNEDSNLATLWEQARNNPGQYKVVDGTRLLRMNWSNHGIF